MSFEVWLQSFSFASHAEEVTFKIQVETKEGLYEYGALM
jgi:hypothetical protein